jgi:hypothetical protein
MHITVKELIEALSKMPPNAPVEASTLDAYTKGIHCDNAIVVAEVRYLPPNEIQLAGYVDKGLVLLLGDKE